MRVDYLQRIRLRIFDYIGWFALIRLSLATTKPSRPTVQRSQQRMANSSVQEITVNVTDIDDEAPAFSSGANFIAAENQTAIGTVTATDIDTNDALITYSISGSELLINALVA